MEWNVAQVVPKIRVNSMSVCKQNNKGSMKKVCGKVNENLSACKQNKGDDIGGTSHSSGSSQNIGNDLEGVPVNPVSSHNNAGNVIPDISISVCKQNNKGSMKRYVEKLMKIYQYVSKTMAMTSEVCIQDISVAARTLAMTSKVYQIIR